ncbi:MAG: LacI family transcriptional regulator [Armatimonadetes bacterium]|nr:LacI family transcriptional regulator [Armatimonadota bacterium]
MQTESLQSTQPKTRTQRGVTLQDVARAVQLSESTVSLVMSGKGRVAPQTRERVRQVARELSFQPNPAGQQLAIGHRNETVGLFALNLDLGVVTQKLQILQNLLGKKGFSTPIYVCGQPEYGGVVDQAELIRNLRLLRPRAIVCNDAGLEQPALDELQRFMDEGGTIVCYDTAIALDCDQVVFDREHNTYLATRHLLELGHRRIGFHLGVVGRAYPNARFAGFQRALNEYNAPLLSQWLDLPQAEAYESAGVRLAQQFLAEKERPTAMCIVNDYASVGFMAHLQRSGLKIPQDVSIVSHDDLPVAALGSHVTLTSASHPVETIANQVARLVGERLDGEYRGASRTVEVRGELSVRESSAPLVMSH